MLKRLKSLPSTRTPGVHNSGRGTGAGDGSGRSRPDAVSEAAEYNSSKWTFGEFGKAFGNFHASFRVRQGLMNRKNQIAIILNLCGLVGLGIGAPGAYAKSLPTGSICSRLVAQLRASPATVLNDLLVKKTMLPPWIVNASSHPAQGDPAYHYLPPDWRTMGGRGASFPTIESLPGTELSMVSAYAGSGDCLQYQFFERKRGGAVRLLGSPPIESDLCSRAGTSGSLATVLGEPSFIVYGSDNPDINGPRLNIIPWKGTSWGLTCHVSIHWLHRYPVKLRYCGSDHAVCVAARRVAPAVERRYEKYSAEQNADFNEIGTFSFKGFRFQSTLTTEGRAIVSRARGIAMSRVTEDEHRGAPSWLRNVIPGDVAFFSLSLDGKLYVATTTGGPDRAGLLHWIVPYAKRYFSEVGAERENGSLLVVYQPPRARSQRLVPLAVLTMHSGTSGIKSIEAGDGYAP